LRDGSRGARAFAQAGREDAEGPDRALGTTKARVGTKEKERKRKKKKARRLSFAFFCFSESGLFKGL
jgi:hypothetical protein